MDWKPWKEFEKELEVLPVVGPPCADCIRWKPVRVYDHSLYSGVKLCHAENMWHDFSCFRNKVEK